MSRCEEHNSQLSECTKKHELTPFGVMVRTALAEKKRTQVDLAKSIGVSKQYLYLVLHGIRPGTQYIDKIIEYCKLDSEAVEKVMEQRGTERGKGK